MICPNCQTQFHTVQAKSHYGANIKIEQCPNCGGIWCDSSDLQRISPDEAQQVDNLNIGKLSNSSTIQKNMHCPQCNNILQDFNDPNFPRQIRLSFCSKCMGFWLNRGELAEYKKWQNIKTAEPKNTTSEDDQKLKKQMDFFLAGAKENNYEALGALGNLLNQQATCNAVYKNDSLPVAAEILLNMVGWIFLGMY